MATVEIKFSFNVKESKPTCYFLGLDRFSKEELSLEEMMVSDYSERFESIQQDIEREYLTLYRQLDKFTPQHNSSENTSIL